MSLFLVSRVDRLWRVTFDEHLGECLFIQACLHLSVENECGLNMVHSEVFSFSHFPLMHTHMCVHTRTHGDFTVAKALHCPQTACPFREWDYEAEADTRQDRDPLPLWTGRFTFDAQRSSVWMNMAAKSSRAEVSSPWPLLELARL